MGNSKWTKGSLEAEISKALTQWEKDFLGRGSVSVKTDILRDMVVVTLNGILTPAEYKLCETKEGLLSVKRIRSDLVESGREKLHQLIRDLTDEELVSFHTDISTRTGERIMIFRLASNLQKKLL
ncbi:DUF2294 domain-containing protein [Aquibacillus sp. 3ASR75-11]|uniref:DUF2294 domain-containing protein n=1 Tax=Terrihalobacillus insolitus TaxID=2950438 RepID=A0A9X3WSP8_9BACI|nr:DUF2294 domain-containing protein [Terrihalobacillus insolitus]MDC3412185.1 DUF2294 domain-containing protein [Terrihalobacillus insolitus]MDC3423121.1 DUF2294 domain-containing protein [Terrihalobacillus insolitus]